MHWGGEKDELDVFIVTFPLWELANLCGLDPIVGIRQETSLRLEQGDAPHNQGQYH